MSRKQKIHIGDVLELPLTHGYTYLQVITEYRDGRCVRLIDLVLSEPGADAEEIAERPDRYLVVMLHIDLEVKEGDLRLVGPAPVPSKYENGLPGYRSNSGREPDGRHQKGKWWFDDGVEKRMIGELPESMQWLPLANQMPARALKDHFERGWDPNWEFKGPEARKFASSIAPVDNPLTGNESRFHLYFKKKVDATKGSESMRLSREFSNVSLEILDDDDGPRFCVTGAVVTRISSAKLSELDALLENLAVQFSGDYDGNEIAL